MRIPKKFICTATSVMLALAFVPTALAEQAGEAATAAAEDAFASIAVQQEGTDADQPVYSDEALSSIQTLGEAVVPEGEAITDGIYFMSLTDSGNVFDLSGGATTAGTVVQLYGFNRSVGQKFTVTYDDETKLCTIVSLKANAPLIDNNGAVVLGSDVQADEAQWSAQINGDKTVSFINKATGMALTGASTDARTALTTSAYVAGSAEQKFDMANAQETQSIEDGTYIVGSEARSSLVLDVASGSVDPDANIQLYTSNMSAAQEYTFTYDTITGYYTITNAKSGLVLGTDGTVNDGSNVQQCQANGNFSQKWIVTKQADGNVTICNASYPRCVLNISGANAAARTNIDVARSTNASTQSWVLIDPTVPSVPESTAEIPENVWYELTPSTCAGSLVGDIEGGSTEDNATFRIHTSNGSIAQVVRFQKVGGYYRIITGIADKALEVQNGSVCPCADVLQVAVDDSSVAQLWSVQQDENGAYTFINKASGLAMDVAGAQFVNNANIWGYTPNGGSAQKFSLIENTALLSEGVYAIAAYKNGTMVLDVASGSTSSGANVQLYGYNTTFAQMWDVIKVSGEDNTYVIQSVKSLRYLTADSSNVYQGEKAISDSCKWIVGLFGGKYTLTNKATGLMLTIPSTDSKANVGVAGAAASDYQKWCFFAVNTFINDGYYIIRSMGNTNISISAAGEEAGNNVTGATYTGSNTQKWKISRNSDGTYKIVNSQSALSLDPAGGAAYSGTNIQVYTANSGNGQKWNIVYDHNGGFKIVSAQNPAVVLDLAGGAVSGANLQVCTANGNPQQSWTFEATTYTPQYSGAQLTMYQKAQSFSSSTRYLILIDTVTCHLGVFTGSQGNWKYVKYWECGPGADSSPTVKGTYSVTGKGYSFNTNGCTCYYYTQFYGNYLIHSILYYENTWKVMDPTMGVRVSHGCVRLYTDRAKWVYDTVPLGTKVFIW